MFDWVSSYKLCSSNRDFLSVTNYIHSKQLMKNLDTNYCEIQKPRQFRSKIIKLARSFTRDEDDLIKAAMEEAGNEKVDYQSLAELLNRQKTSVMSRVDIIKRTGGVKKTKKFFTLVEDLTLIETLIIPRLSTQKLSEFNLPTNQCVDLSIQLDKTVTGVRYRWSMNLQPWLLQHYSGRGAYFII